MVVEFTLCDVFAERPLSGNQLAVFLDADNLTAEHMASLVGEFGWSEATFVSSAVAPDVPRVRIWSPYGELPFAGHPTIGTAVVLAARGRWPEPRGEMELGVGRVAVEVTLDGAQTGVATMTQQVPTFGVVLENRDRVARALGLQIDDLAPELPVQFVSTGREHLMVPVRSLAALQRIHVQEEFFPPGGEEHPHVWAYAFTSETPGSIAGARARLVGPNREDAATGSAAGPLGAYLVHYGVHRAGTLEIEQGIERGRPSRLLIGVPVIAGEIGQVAVTGRVHIWAHGVLLEDAVASGRLET